MVCVCRRTIVKMETSCWSAVLWMVKFVASLPLTLTFVVTWWTSTSTRRLWENSARRNRFDDDVMVKATLNPPLTRCRGIMTLSYRVCFGSFRVSVLSGTLIHSTIFAQRSRQHFCSFLLRCSRVLKASIPNTTLIYAAVLAAWR